MINPDNFLSDAMYHLWAGHSSCRRYVITETTLGGINMSHLCKCHPGDYDAMRLLEAVRIIAELTR